MTFRLGTKSEGHLVGVIPPMVKCVRRSIVTTAVDFSATDGLRAVEEQREFVRTGASKTMNSKHLPQYGIPEHPEWDGMSHAVDLAPYVLGKLKYTEELCCQVAVAMREASVYYREPMVWGAVFDRKISELDPFHLADEIEEYKARFRLRHKNDPKRKPFIDMPHFQWGEP